MKICYVLAYRDPNYIRSRSLLAALRLMPDVQLVEAINTHSGPRRYWEIFRKLAAIIKSYEPDIYILGFRGHEFYWPLRFLVGKKPIVLDALMSPYASLTEERKFGTVGAVAGTFWRKIEHGMLKNANLIITDTTQHCRFYQQEFSLSTDKILALPVGGDERISISSPPPTCQQENPAHTMNILFYGSFLPLHGIDVIVDAASLLGDLPIHFHFVGGNRKQADALKSRCADLGVRNYTHRCWLANDVLLSSEIPAADLCLGGPFGDTPQARRVITGKTSQCLAQGKPTVIGQVDEEIGFRDKENCLLVPQGNPEALAKAIRWAFNHRSELEKIAQQGKELYAEMLSTNVISQRLHMALTNIEKSR